jgi:CubicO group peptidase (beta-lactamase class C family)
MKGRVLTLTAAVMLLAGRAQAQPAVADPTQAAAQRALIARAKALELPTRYTPPPGDPMEHFAAAYAKIMCTAVFVTGLEPAFAEQNVGFFTAPYELRARLGKPQVDAQQRAVAVRAPNGTVRVAKRVGSQGCVILPPGRSAPFFRPSIVHSALPPASAQPWPMGDVLPSSAPPPEVDARKVEQAVQAAFAPEGMTAALVITYRGRIIAERYGEHISPTTPLESWSMGKSVAATLLGVLMQQGVYTLSEPAPIPEWQSPGDARAQIRIEDLMHMSSGLRIISPVDPDYDPNGPYPDHWYLYTGPVDLFKYAATRPLQWPPNTVGRYRNSDPVLASYLIRLAVEKRGEDYHSFPQRALFDRIGVRTLVLDTDAYGNFLLQGDDAASGRDWARLGNLYLQDGVWNGQRLLPEGFAKFVSTVAPAWQADHRPVYGGFFWINGDGAFPGPKEIYYMSGAGGQFVVIIPSHQLVVARLGHYRGEAEGTRALAKAVGILLDAMPSASTAASASTPPSAAKPHH